MARLIDADALFKAIKSDKIAWRFGVPNTLGLMFDHIKIIINEQPTVDAVPAVHGRWIDEYPFVRCSVCNAEWLNCRTDNEPKLFYYCPNCGAKMDMEE